MLPFSYQRAKNEQDALAFAAGGQAAFIAGGTTLVDLMKLSVEVPAALVDVNALPLNTIEDQPDGSIRVGALVRNSELAHDSRILSRFPVLSQALLAGASAQLRNMATTGGNLMQRTRCYYFRDTTYPCNKRSPGAGCSAIEGFNRIHAVLGGSDHCIATHPSDMAVALVALDAVVHARSNREDRAIPVADFHLLPGDTPERETVLEPGELITHVTLPVRPFAAASAYVKLRDRASYEFALASAAAALEVQGETIRSVRLALGGVATKPWRAIEAESLLTGATANEATFRRAADAALRGAVPRRHNGFKIELAKRAVVRALNLATERSV
ncbi:MAG: FAD-binding molybdopterin dehydrogenase [Blastocatellia bacterium]|nr:MAG: FAD-binding molybdopterin dehydrogenase [Blastocatellia bacterium]